MAKAVLGYQYLAFEWCMLAVTFLIVLIRLYIRVYLQGPIWKLRTWRMSEIFVILGWLLAMGVGICDSVKVHAGSKNLSKGFKMTPEEMIKFYKAQFAWSWMYKPSVYMMKFALLFFYVDLTEKVQQRKVWVAVIVTAVFNTIGLIAQWLFIALQCVPWSKQWSLSSTENCANIAVYPSVTWGFYVLTDLMIFILPFAILKTTLQAGKHSFGDLSGALIMFGLGIINVLSAIVIMVLRLQPENYLDRPKTSLGEATELLYTLELATAIAIPCCPQMRQFVKRVTGKNRDSLTKDQIMNTYISSRNKSMKIGSKMIASSSENELNVDIEDTATDGNATVAWDPVHMRQREQSATSF